MAAGLRLSGIALLACVLALPTASAGPGGLLQATVVGAGCQVGLEDVRVSVTYRGKVRNNVARTDHRGYFEVDMARLYPDWVAGSGVTVALEKGGYVRKHRNLQATGADSNEIPLEREAKTDPTAERYGTLANYRKDDCSSWTVFAVPHKSDGDAVFPDYDHAQEMHLRLSTYFQELDLPIEKLPSVSVEWLEGAQDLNLTGSEPANLGAYLNAIALLYGNVDAKGKTEPRVSSYLQIVADRDSRTGVTKVTQRTPLADLDDDIYEEDSSYIRTLTRSTLFAAVYRELEKAKAAPKPPNHHARLAKIREFITAERKTFPKESAQSSVDKNNLQTLGRLQMAVDTTLGETGGSIVAAK